MGDCDCPSHHEHGPEGATGCAICNQEARSGRRQPLDGTTPVTLCTCGHHPDAHDPWGCVLCGGTSACSMPVPVGQRFMLGDDRAAVSGVKPTKAGSCAPAPTPPVDESLPSFRSAVSQEELTAALHAIITRLAGPVEIAATEPGPSPAGDQFTFEVMSESTVPPDDPDNPWTVRKIALAGGQATIAAEDSSNFTRESSGPDRLPPTDQMIDGRLHFWDSVTQTWMPYVGG